MQQSLAQQPQPDLPELRLLPKMPAGGTPGDRFGSDESDKQLVDLMGGEIGLTSAEGKGSTVWFALPLAVGADRRPELPAAREPGGARVNRALVGSRVLLAEDNEINQRIAIRMLKKHGFLVEVAENGRVALDMYRASRYRAIFMDCHMPELDGYQTTAEIRRLEGHDEHVPIIAMTANTVRGDRELCLAAGMDDYVPKPVTAEALNDAIARSLLHRDPVGPGRRPTPETAPAPFGPEPPLLDPATLQEVCDGDEQLRRDLVSLFFEQAEAALPEIAAAIAGGDNKALYLNAHHLKGSSGSVGAVRIAELCGLLCAAGRTGDMDQARRLLPDLGTCYRRTSDLWRAAPLPV